jgi:hypothetical protein
MRFWLELDAINVCFSCNSVSVLKFVTCNRDPGYTAVLASVQPQSFATEFPITENAKDFLFFLTMNFQLLTIIKNNSSQNTLKSLNYISEFSRTYSKLGSVDSLVDRTEMTHSPKNQ